MSSSAKIARITQASPAAAAREQETKASPEAFRESDSTTHDLQLPQRDQPPPAPLSSNNAALGDGAASAVGAGAVADVLVLTQKEKVPLHHLRWPLLQSAPKNGLRWKAKTS